jgi:hypothetical protein
MKNLEKYPLVYCVWQDIVSTDTNWREIDEAIHWVDTESGMVSQCGFMLEKNDEYLILLDSFFNEGEMVGAVTRIPIETVKFIKQVSIEDFKK